jgi:hypothetical protein
MVNFPSILKVKIIDLFTTLGLNYILLVFNTDVGDGFRRYGKLKRYLDLKKIQHDESESRYSCSIKIPEYCVKIIE